MLRKVDLMHWLNSNGKIVMAHILVAPTPIFYYFIYLYFFPLN